MTRKPIIGFTLDYENGGTKEGSYSKMPFYAIRENYCTAVSDLGAIPFPLVHETGLVGDFLDKIDGLVIIGGAFDVHPSLYGEASVHDTVVLKEKRTRFEWEITQGALERKIPLLGICGGQQLLNVVLGGTLIQHIPDSIAEALAHEEGVPERKPQKARATGGKEKDPDTIDLEKRVSDALGLKVTVNHRDPGGSVQINYRNLDQLDEVMKRLAKGAL